MFHLKLEELGNNVYLVVTALADKKRYILVCVCMLKAIHHQKFVLQTNNFKDKQYLLETTVVIFCIDVSSMSVDVNSTGIPIITPSKY
jgi:hypothetical protein